MSTKEKNEELGRVESSNARECSVECQRENRPRETLNAAAYNGANSFIRYSILEFPQFSGQD